MPYRNVPAPCDAPILETTEDWVAWANGENLIPSVAPAPESSCRTCFGSVREQQGGGHFSLCDHCFKYRHVLDAVVPIVYSLDDGLESLLHHYKDFEGDFRWMGLALGSVSYEFMSSHLECIEDRFGEVAVATSVPSGNDARDFDHIADIIDSIDGGWPVEWDLGLVSRAEAGRPSRGAVVPSHYGVTAGRTVKGASVLLFDDTWTSGSSIASVAAMLKLEGARCVVAVTIGRQLKAGWGSADDLIAAARSRGFDNDRCVLCG